MKTAVGTDMGCRYGMDLVEKRHAKSEQVDSWQARLNEKIETLDSGEVKDVYDEMGNQTHKVARITDALSACSACKGDPDKALLSDGVCPMARMVVSKTFE